MQSEVHDPGRCSNPGCRRCATRLPFELPDEIVTATVEGRLVVFAGAGVSTESRAVFPTTLYDEVKRDLALPSDEWPTFPALMSRYCGQRDGRARLLRKIKDRLTYVESFPELYTLASAFHRQLATIPQVENIVTTNWDNLFEQHCAATPIVTAEDFVFWSMPGRKVLKIHGSTSNYGSIIASIEDYRKCYRRLSTGLIGSQLKLFLATRTVVFIGYSFGDYDFNRVHGLLSREMRDVLPHSYIVTLDDNAVNRAAVKRMSSIVTDATYFVEVLKQRLVTDGLMVADSVLTYAARARALAMDAHRRLLANYNMIDNPPVIYSASYQDGLLHAYERVISMARTGYYSDPDNINSSIASYRHIRGYKLHRCQFHDVAYVDGYIMGLESLLSDHNDVARISPYYIYGAGSIASFDDFERAMDATPTFDELARLFAERLSDQIASQGVAYHHSPFL